jgi:hypothetical protein
MIKSVISISGRMGLKCEFVVGNLRLWKVELSVTCSGWLTVWQLYTNLTGLTGSVFSRERYAPMRFSRGGRKLPWITGELSCLKNKETKAANRSKASEKALMTVNANSCEGNFYHSEKNIS